MPDIGGVIKIISDGKATVTNLVDLSRFILSINTVNVVIILIDVHFSIYYNSFQIIITYSAVYVLALIFFSFGTGIIPISKYKINDRFFTIRNFSVIFTYATIYFIYVLVITLIAIK